MALEPQLKAQLDTLISDNKVVLFMKGTRRMPQCGFSATVVGILDGVLDDYQTVNVLADPAIRAGIKEYSDWPTIPQLYIGGEFQGGCDIVREMAGSGELHSALGVEMEAIDPPSMTLTDAAAEALREATADVQGESLRFAIPANYRYELTVGPKMFGDVEVEVSGFTFLMDPASAKRGEGTVIDFVSGAMGSGFSITNPAEPKKVQQLPAPVIKEWLDEGEVFEFLDVRGPEERAIAAIPGARALDATEVARLDALPKDTKLVFHCHHGMRSQAAAEEFIGRGFTEVYNLAGGIEAWSKQVDSSVPSY